MTTTATPQGGPLPNGDNGQPPAQTAASSEGNGRDARGRFTKGNHGGPGNPFARRLAQIRQDFFSGIAAGELKAVARKLVAMAKDGDHAAIETGRAAAGAGRRADEGTAAGRPGPDRRRGPPHLRGLGFLAAANLAGRGAQRREHARRVLSPAREESPMKTRKQASATAARTAHWLPPLGGS
jgi:hypothetical protein